MGLFVKRDRNIALLDIRSSSIGVGFAVVGGKNPPALVYQTRVPLDTHATERQDEALIRTIEAALKSLVTEGAPVLRKITGSAHTDEALVSFSAPWQHSRVFSRVINPGKTFVFSKESLLHATSDATPIPKEWTLVSEMNLATLLNGYQVKNPYGKRVKHAEVIVLSSLLSTALMNQVTHMVRKSLHQSHIRFEAFSPALFDAFSDLYPELHDYLVLDIGNEATDVLLAKHGFLMSANSIQQGIGDIARAVHTGGVSSATVPVAEASPILDTSRNAQFASHTEGVKQEWLDRMSQQLTEIARQEPLPRSVYLLSEVHTANFLINLLDSTAIRCLWLSDTPLSITPITPDIFTPYFAKESVKEIDPPLAVLAFTADKQGK